jgi:uncharacterized protein (TIGR02265 family)
MFAEPDWSQPVDFASRVAAVPPDAQVRGMFLQVLVDSLPTEIRSKLGARRYVAFKNYPMREYVELLAFSAGQARSQKPAECVRRLGRLIYPTYVKTLSGSTIFALAGRDYGRVVDAAPVAYKVAVSDASVLVRTIEPCHIQVELRKIYNLPEFHQVGVWEGAMQVCGATGSIHTRVIDFGAVDFEVRWQNGSGSLRPR